MESGTEIKKSLQKWTACVDLELAKRKYIGDNSRDHMRLELPFVSLERIT